jgi:hypothetical protein
VTERQPVQLPKSEFLRLQIAGFVQVDEPSLQPPADAATTVRRLAPIGSGASA